MATVRDPGRIILTALSVVLSSTIGFGQTLPPLRGVYPLGMNSINAGVTPESGFTYTQARHWFAELLFDLILYRSENIHAQLGVGLPDGFTTYRNLATRVDWFRRSLPFQFFWVHEDGAVTIE